MEDSKKALSIKSSDNDPKFTPERRLAIIDALAHQIPHEHAAFANGVHLGTFWDWIRRGKEETLKNMDTDYTRFVSDIYRAEMQCIRGHLDIIAARPDNWEAHAWLLERRWNEHYNQI